MTITIGTIGTNPVLFDNTTSNRVPTFEVYINDKKISGVKVIEIDKYAGGNADTALIEFPRNRFYNLGNFNKGYLIEIYANKSKNPKPVFSGELVEPSTDIHPSTTLWECMNFLRKLNNYPVSRVYNYDNNRTYNFYDLTGFAIADIIEDVLANSEVNIQWRKDTFPYDYPGEVEVNGEEAMSVILAIIDQAGQKYTTRVKYNTDGSQVFETWKFGSANNTNRKMIIGTKDRIIKKAELGVANINSGTYLEDNTDLVNRLYGFGDKKVVETTVILTPAWDSTLEDAVEADRSLKQNNPEVYGDVFQKWELPQWYVKDSKTGSHYDEFKYRLTYPRVNSKLNNDDNIFLKDNVPFLWINNIKNIQGDYVSINPAGVPYNMKVATEGFSIQQDKDGNDRYLILDDVLGMGMDDDLDFDPIKTAGQVLLTAEFMIEEELWVDSGKQGTDPDERIRFIKMPDRMKWRSRGYSPLGYNPNYSGSNILNGSIIPSYSTSTRFITGYTQGTYMNRDDSQFFIEKLRNMLLNTQEQIRKMFGVIMPRMDTTVEVSDYDTVYGLNVTHVHHDCINMRTGVDLASA